MLTNEIFRFSIFDFCFFFYLIFKFCLKNYLILLNLHYAIQPKLWEIYVLYLCIGVNMYVCMVLIWAHNLLYA